MNFSLATGFVLLFAIFVITAVAVSNYINGEKAGFSACIELQEIQNTKFTDVRK